MPNLVAISQATAKINRGAESAPPQALSVSNHPGQIGLKLHDLVELKLLSFVYESVNKLPSTRSQASRT